MPTSILPSGSMTGNTSLHIVLRGPLLAALAGLLSACATAPRQPSPPAHPAGPFVEGALLDGATGAPLDRDALRIRLAASRHIYVGERHTDPRFHRVQAEVLELLLELRGEVVVAIEWLPGSQAAALATWLDGDGDRASLEAAVSWRRFWGPTLEAYAPLLELARARGVPVVAANAEPGPVRELARRGAAGLPPHVRAALPPLDSADDQHRATFAAMMARVAHAHAMGPEALDRYYLAQLARDEAMARVVANLLADHPERRVVVFAGVGHIDHGLGVPARAAHLSRAPFAIVRPIDADELERADRVIAPAYPERLADALWLIPPPPRAGATSAPPHSGNDASSS